MTQKKQTRTTDDRGLAKIKQKRHLRFH